MRRDIVYYGDGEGAFRVSRISEKGIFCVAKNDFYIINGKSISCGYFEQDKAVMSNILDSIGDMEVSLLIPFTESVDVINDIRGMVHNNVSLIAKIETESGMNNIEEIARKAEGILIGRGDLALYSNLKDLFPNLRDAIEKVRENKIIFCTGILQNFSDAYMPERAEIFDLMLIKQLYANELKTILANQMYTGDMVQGKKQKCIAEGRNTQKKQKEEDYVIVPNTHEALIDRSLFDKVQKICREELEANREKRKKYTDISSTENLLKNKIFSAEGLKMYRGRNVYKNERVTYNYVTSKSRKNDGTYYKFVYISEEKVFQALKKAIYFYIELLFSIENSHMDRKRKEKAEIEQKQLKKEIANSQKNVEWYTRRLADTYKEKTEGKIQMEDYIKKQTEYRACKEAAQEKIKELSDKYEIYKMQLLGNPDYFAVYETFLKTEELNKMLIDVLVKKITVAENTKIEITFQFEDEMKMLYERLKESCSA